MSSSGRGSCAIVCLGLIRSVSSSRGHIISSFMLHAKRSRFTKSSCVSIQFITTFETQSLTYRFISFISSTICTTLNSTATATLTTNFSALVPVRLACTPYICKCAEFLVPEMPVDLVMLPSLQWTERLAAQIPEVFAPACADVSPLPVLQPFGTFAHLLQYQPLKKSLTCRHPTTPVPEPAN